jgi:ABC-2 type transport system ATP-binding protein
VEVTVDRDVAQAPENRCFDKIELQGERTLTITYRKDRVNAGEVLAALQEEGLGVIDVSTREADLEDKANAYSRTLSGGMKRRLLVAKAMVHSPPILVLDEPTAGVDVELRQQLWDYVRSLNAQGVTIVLTTHYLEEAEQLCDRIAIINHGKLIANEATRDLLALAQEKVVEVVVDRDVTVAPENLCFDKIELAGERTLTITYRKDKVNAGDVLAALHREGLGIVDVSTREADLEDVFLNLTRAANI